MSQISLEDIFEWDVVNWSRAKKIWDSSLHNSSNGRALTLGERGGGLSLYLASKGFNVTCTDLREFPESTTLLHQKHQVQDLINYQHEDMMNLSFEDNSFNVLMFKSVIGALSTKENQQKAMDEMFRVLKPGGMLLFAENAQASKLHQFARKKFIKWNAYWRYVSLKDDMDLFADFTIDKMKTVGFLGAFGRSERQRKFLGKCDHLIQQCVTPSMRYIIIGSLKKPL